MNLLEKRWIPVRRASGQREWIAPHEVTDGIDTDPIVALYAPRPDFNGALIQFLIGLVQTAWVRAEKFWDREEMLWEPPKPQALAALFAPLKEAFELEGDGPRFMQELSLRPSGKESELRDVRALLIEAPGKETLSENRDHFVKRHAVEAMCYHCCAAALFTLQIHAPSGGRGHLPSLRKGGELTTLVVFTEDETGRRPALWRDIACNVLDSSSFRSLCDVGRKELKFTFPWLAPLEDLQRLGGQTWPRDVHPAHLFWAMPRRIRLDFGNVDTGVCDLCGEKHQPLVARYFTWPNGLNYNGESKEEKAKRKEAGADRKSKRSAFPVWQHPLSPYERSAAKSIPVKLDDGGLTYRHWLGAAIGSRRGGTEVLPAAAVEAFRSAKVQPGQVRLWAFGYETDNMKARCWYETVFPLFDLRAGQPVSTETSELIAHIVDRLIGAAEEAAVVLRDAIGDAQVRPTPSQKRDPNWRESMRRALAFVERSFWGRTEREFYSLVEQTIALCRHQGRAAYDQSEPLRRSWLDTLRRVALRLFDEIAASGSVAAGDPAKLAAAHRNLHDWLYGKHLLVALELVAGNAGRTSPKRGAVHEAAIGSTTEAG